MKALTLTQPWATLIAVGAKTIETRSWRTDYRGPLAIHAAKTFPWSAQTFANEDRQCNGALKAGLLCYPGQMRALRHLLTTRDACASDLPTGAIVAVCELALVLPVEHVRNRTVFECLRLADHRTQSWHLTENELAFGDYSAGRFAWLLTNIRALPTPIPAKGALGLWDYDGELPQ